MTDPTLTRGTLLKGTRNITGVVNYEPRPDRIREVELDIDYHYIEVEENRVDVEVEMGPISAEFLRIIDDPCTPDNFDEMVQYCIREDIEKVLGHKWSVRNVNYEPFKYL